MLLDRYKSETHTKTKKKVYETIEREYDRLCGCQAYHSGNIEQLMFADSEIYELLRREYDRIRNTIGLTAAQNICSRPVLAALGSVFQNKTAEGAIGSRWHAGCEVVDKVEALAAARAKEAFRGQYANVQPHSGSTANQIVFQGLLEPGDTVLSLDVLHGGHPSHGGLSSFAHKCFKIENYCVEPGSYQFDYYNILEKAKEVRPRMILCGASIYPRFIDFARFRAIADEVGAYLLADISHIAGQVIAGIHPSPIDHAHVTTSSTYKAGGPRGGIILCGRDHAMQVETAAGSETLAEALARATFPGVQGTPYFNSIAAKAIFFKETASQSYRDYQSQVVANAARLALDLNQRGLDVLTLGSDNHMVLVNADNLNSGIGSITAQQGLEQCGIITDSFRLAHQSTDKPAAGLRLGTPVVTARGMKEEQMDIIAELFIDILNIIKPLSENRFAIEPAIQKNIADRVQHLCDDFPIG